MITSFSSSIFFVPSYFAWNFPFLKRERNPYDPISLCLLVIYNQMEYLDIIVLFFICVFRHYFQWVKSKVIYYNFHSFLFFLFIIIFPLKPKSKNYNSFSSCPSIIQTHKANSLSFFLSLLVGTKLG